MSINDQPWPGIWTPSPPLTVFGLAPGDQVTLYEGEEDNNGYFRWDYAALQILFDYSDLIASATLGISPNGENISPVLNVAAKFSIATDSGQASYCDKLSLPFVMPADYSVILYSSSALGSGSQISCTLAWSFQAATPAPFFPG